MKEKIPAAAIGLLSQILPDYYTHGGINSLFLTASAPEDVPEGNKSVKVQTWLRTINNNCPNPLEILGSVISDFMDGETHKSYYSSGSEDEYARKKNETREKLVSTLAKDGLGYSRGGHITKGGSIPTQSLKESVSKQGLSAVDAEIKRALNNVEKDPLAAIHAAGSVVESSLKAYLDHHKLQYKDESDTLSDLWKKVVDHVGINPKELDDKDLKKIASGLYSIVDGTMHLRNKKSAAHGKSEEQLRQNTIRPRHARLAIHAAHTISAYILELIA